jgi:hypothetical protein
VADARRRGVGTGETAFDAPASRTHLHPIAIGAAETQISEALGRRTPGPSAGASRAAQMW